MNLVNPVEGRAGSRHAVNKVDPAQKKGWFVGPWNSDLGISIGYANAGIDEPHVHTMIREVYLVARGCSSVRVERETVRLEAGDMLVLEQGEAHTLLDSSTDYLHFVLHVSGMAGDTARSEKQLVSRDRLDLDKWAGRPSAEPMRGRADSSPSPAPNDRTTAN